MEKSYRLIFNPTNLLWCLNPNDPDSPEPTAVFSNPERRKVKDYVWQNKIAVETNPEGYMGAMTIHGHLMDLVDVRIVRYDGFALVFMARRSTQDIVKGEGFLGDDAIYDPVPQDGLGHYVIIGEKNIKTLKTKLEALGYFVSDDE